MTRWPGPCGRAHQHPLPHQHPAGYPRGQRRGRGFTLLELLVVLAIVAVAAAGVGFALRDDTAARLEREALRLGALLEAGRAQAQVAGVALRWYPTADGFRFEPEGLALADPAQRQWLDPDTRAEVLPAGAPLGTADAVDAAAARNGRSAGLLLGPDPIIGPQALALFAASQPQRRLRLATDGVRPFAVQADPEVAP